MKAIMSNELRAILNDPEKNKELKQSVSRLNNRSTKVETVSIGGKTYSVKIVNRNPKD